MATPPSSSLRPTPTTRSRSWPRQPEPKDRVEGEDRGLAANCLLPVRPRHEERLDRVQRPRQPAVPVLLGVEKGDRAAVVRPTEGGVAEQAEFGYDGEGHATQWRDPPGHHGQRITTISRAPSMRLAEQTPASTAATR